MTFTWIGWMLLWFNFKPFWLVLMCGGWDLFSALACCHPHVKSCSKCSGTRFYFWCRQNHEELFSWLHLMESNKTQGRGGWWIVDCTKGDVAGDKSYWNNSWAARGMGMYLFRAGRRRWIHSILPAESWPLEQSNGISYLDHDETVTFQPDSECIADLHRYPPRLSGSSHRTAVQPACPFWVRTVALQAK